jgi:hypothetical protein
MIVNIINNIHPCGFRVGSAALIKAIILSKWKKIKTPNK